MNDVLSLETESEQANLIAMARRLRPAVIAIDGPAAAGKSTVGYQLAQHLDFLFFDTGVMYRAVTWAALQHGIAVVDAPQVGALANNIQLDLLPPTPEQHDGRQCTVLVNGEDVTWHLRTPEVDQRVSVVSTYPAVRQALSVQQRRIGDRYGSGQAEKGGVVMVGRDIGTVVMPTAGLKIFMEATAIERARRRFCEQRQRDKSPNFVNILEDIQRRDKIDSERALSPLRQAEDAVVIDTSTLLPAEVVDEILLIACEKVQNSNEIIKS